MTEIAHNDEKHVQKGKDFVSKKTQTLAPRLEAFLKARKTGMITFIDPPQSPISRAISPNAIFVIFIMQKSSSGVVQITKTGSKPAIMYMIIVKFGASYTPIVNEDYGRRIAGVLAVGCLSQRRIAGEIKRADGDN